MPRSINFLTGPGITLVGYSALAHPGFGGSGITAGLLHPLTGLDHIVSMLAIGFWAAQSRGQRILVLPVTFITALLCGALLGFSFPAFPIIETGIAASVSALGLIFMASFRLTTMPSLFVTALFGLLHGYAHGQELPGSHSPLQYGIGFLITSAALLLGGAMLALSLKDRKYPQVPKWAGACIFICGIYLLIA